MRSPLRTAALILAATALTASSAAGQLQAVLTLTQTPNVFPAPTVADYNAGYVTNPTGIAFTVAGNKYPKTTSTTTVSVRASSSTLGGGKPIADLEWRRGDLSTWNAMTTTNAAVESRPVFDKTLNDPWSNTLFLRMKLSWASDAPATYSSGLVFTLTATSP